MELKPKTMLSLWIALAGMVIATLLPVVVGTEQRFLPTIWVPTYIVGWIATVVGWISFAAQLFDER